MAAARATDMYILTFEESIDGGAMRDIVYPDVYESATARSCAC